MNEPETLVDLARTPAERAASAVPWAGGAVWTAAEIMHWQAWPGMTPEAAVGAVAAFGLTFGIGAYKGWGWKAPVLVTAFAAWLVFASARGPLSGWPVPSLTIVLAALTGIARHMALRHPSILEAVRWRARRAEWLAVRHEWNLPGSHLLEHTETWLGERFLVDVLGTRKLPSVIARDASLPEWIAIGRGIPRSRVTVKEVAGGRVLIDVRDRDPWAKPVPHPLLDPDPRLAGLAGADADAIAAIRDGAPCTIKDPVPVGQDPATGAMLTVPLWDEIGGKNVNVVGLKGAGKTILLNNLSEGVTRAADAVMIRVNVSIKGHAEPQRWGPACLLSAFAPHQQARSVEVLQAVLGVLEWRSRQYAASQYEPSPEDPLLVVFVDESDAAMAVPQARKLADDIATKGREYGASLVKAGQRGTADYSSAKQRSQDDVFCLGKVNRATEAMHAAGDLGLRLPDMAAYGEGHAGVWVIAQLGSPAYQAGRTWNLSEPTDIAGIAADRAHSQPDLPAACKAFLGDQYAALAGSDVYARWARDRSPVPATPAPQDTSGGGERETAAAPVAVISDDPTEHMDWAPMDDDMRARFRALDEKIKDAKAVLAETEAMPPLPVVPEEKLKASSEARWAMFAEQTEIPPQFRGRMLELMSGEGMSGRKITEALMAENPGSPPKRAWVMAWLNRLRWEEVAYVDGKGPAARWRLTAERGDGS